jgi:hypothetical protein
MNECLCPVIKNSATPREQTSLLCYIQLKVHWNIYNAKTMYTALVTSMRRGVPAGSESYPWTPLICLHQWLRLAKGSIPWWCEGKRRTYKHPFVHWLVQAVGTSRPTVPGSDYVCLDINKLMYDLEHDDEMVVISSLLKWLPAEVLYHMRHAARCALRVVVVDKPSGSPLHLL